MKALSLFSLLFVLQLATPSQAYTDHGQFKVEMVKPWGEFGFRALGKGKNISEMRFDCAKTSDMGFVVTIVNNYGKTSNIVLPGEKLGSDKHKCQKTLKKYFANLYTKRGLASLKHKGQQRRIDLDIVQSKKTLSFR